MKLTENICLEPEHGSIPTKWLTVSYSCHNDVMIIYPNYVLYQDTVSRFYVCNQFWTPEDITRSSSKWYVADCKRLSVSNHCDLRSIHIISKLWNGSCPMLQEPTKQSCNTQLCVYNHIISRTSGGSKGGPGWDMALQIFGWPFA